MTHDYEPLPDLLTVPLICDYLGVARSTLHGWWAAGRGPRRFNLPNGQVRVRREHLEDWLSLQELEAA